MVARPIVVRNNFQGRVLDIIRIKEENSIQMDWKFEGSKQQINCSRI